MKHYKRRTLMQKLINQKKKKKNIGAAMCVASLKESIN